MHTLKYTKVQYCTGRVVQLFGGRKAGKKVTVSPSSTPSYKLTAWVCRAAAADRAERWDASGVSVQSLKQPLFFVHTLRGILPYTIVAEALLYKVDASRKRFRRTSRKALAGLGLCVCALLTGLQYLCSLF